MGSGRCENTAVGSAAAPTSLGIKASSGSKRIVSRNRERDKAVQKELDARNRSASRQSRKDTLTSLAYVDDEMIASSSDHSSAEGDDTMAVPASLLVPKPLRKYRLGSFEPAATAVDKDCDTDDSDKEPELLSLRTIVLSLG